MSLNSGYFKQSRQYFSTIEKKTKNNLYTGVVYVVAFFMLGKNVIFWTSFVKRFMKTT